MKWQCLTMETMTVASGHHSLISKYLLTVQHMPGFIHVIKYTGQDYPTGDRQVYRE